MFGKQGKPAKANVGTPVMGKKSGGKVYGAGNVAKPAPVKGIKGNNNKLK